jgi:AcrR family transcriptional regulator
MTVQIDGRLDSPRMTILAAAAGHLSAKPYSQVNLDDILLTANVTKGALYSQFRSKQELATAVMEHRAEVCATLFDDAFFCARPGLDAVIEVLYIVALEETHDEMARAGFNLLEALGRFDGLQSKILEGWVTSFESLVRRAVNDGDVVATVDPNQVARLLVSMYMGLRQTSQVEDAGTFIRDLESAWLLVLPGFANPERHAYLTAFVRRRTALAIKNAASCRADNL